MKLGPASLARIFSALVFMFAGLKPSMAQMSTPQISFLPNVYMVDGATYLTISDAYHQCADAGKDNQDFCEIWDYNLANGEVMNTLPWAADGSGKPFDLHLGPGTLTICSASPCTTPLTFVIPPLSRVTGVGRNGTAATAGTVVKAGANFTPSARQPLVQLGSLSGGSPKTSFGSLLSSVTVDCNKKAFCIAIENVGAQEQGGIEHVNAVNYAVFGVWFHGSGAQNSHMFDVEVNGCTSVSSCLITSTTVPLEIDNVPSLRPIVGITVNPVNTLGGTISLASYSGGLATYTVSMTGMLTNTDWVSINNISPIGYDGTFLVNSATGSTNTTSFTVSMPNPGSFTSASGATVARVPLNDVVVCSGTCPDSSTPPGDSTSPTPATFVGAHAEHGRYGFDVKGAAATLNLIGTSCPNNGSYSNVSVCAVLEAGIQSAHLENFYPGPATFASLEDDNFSYNPTQNFLQLYDIGASSGGLNNNRTRHCSEADCTDRAAILAQSNVATQTPLVVSPGPGVTQSSDLFEIFSDSGLTSKTVSADSSGNLNVAGNLNVTTVGGLRLIGTTTADVATFGASGQLQDSGSQLPVVGTAGIGFLWLPTVVSPPIAVSSQTISGAANQVRVVQFVLPYKTTVRHIVSQVQTGSAGNFNIGIYDSSKNLLLGTASIGCGTTGIKNTSVTATDLQPGTYYFAFAATDTTCALNGFSSSSVVQGISNQNTPRFATASGALSGGSLPGSLGTLTSTTFGVPTVMVEP